MIVDGKDYGVQGFLVPIRSLDDHKPLPGVKVGDLGSKFGYNYIDNGWLSFDQFRIPRENIFSRFIEVTKDGKVSAKGDQRVTYQIMAKTRLGIVFQSGVNLMQGGIIAVRYAICRRQFRNQKGSAKERKLLDYQSHMAVIAPNIANAMIILMTSKLIKNLNKQSDANILKENFKLLPMLHHFTSGMKAIASEMMYNGLDQLRQSCGGAGFSLASGISQQFLEASPFSTFEGVNVVMLQ